MGINWSSMKREANLVGTCQVYKKEKDFIEISIEIKDMEIKKIQNWINNFQCNVILKYGVEI